MVPIERLLADAEEHRLRVGRPLVTLSYAQSLDGSIAARWGESTPLSGHESLILTHRLRAAHDAIMIGVGTVLADNPRLTVRLVEGDNPQPIVLDSNLRIPLDANLLRGERLPWIATTEFADPERQAALEADGARILKIPTDKYGQVSLPAVLERLADLEISSLMVEGGARVITSFLSQLLVDQVVLTIVPIFMGGLSALESNRLLKDSFPHLKNLGYEQLGEDLVVWGNLDW